MVAQTEKLKKWLEDNGLGRYVESFHAQDIGIDVLVDLSDADLERLGLSLGDQKRFRKAIASLQHDSLEDGAPESPLGQLAAAPGPERRQLTVLFCDLAGSTKLALQLDPEELRNIIAIYQDSCADVINRFGGKIARYFGDGILAYFGYPLAQEDSTESAVRAALALIDVIGGLETEDAHRLKVRIGIATGLVLVGEHIGEGAAMEEAAVGATPHLAARLHSLADPGQIIISDKTHDLVAGFFKYEDLGLCQLKGFEAPTRAWKVLEISEVEGRFEALHSEGLTPLVGRDNELELLLRLWDEARQGRGQIALVGGEAGIGKSRLALALREHLRLPPESFLRFQCSRFDANNPLFPVIQSVERIAQLEVQDSPEEKLRKLEKHLSLEGDHADEARSFIAQLLSIRLEDARSPTRLDAEMLKERTLDALVAQLVALSGRSPVLLTFEDLHWIDPTSLELLDRIVSIIQELPLLGLFTFRPDFALPWSGSPHVTEIVLNRLGRRHGGELVNGVVQRKTLPSIVIDQIVSKADGVPLFVEELTKTVLGSGLVADVGDHYELTGEHLAPLIPSSLQDSLMARLDQLGQAKEIAQIGAVIGRDMPLDLLENVTETIDNRVRTKSLSQLVDAGLIYVKSRRQQPVYTFKHALVQDAAYQSLLKSKRRFYHREVYYALVESYPNVADAHPELLAHHATESDLVDEALDHWWHAGRKAMAKSAHAEAIAHLTRGLDLLGELHNRVLAKHHELKIQAALGQAMMATKGYAAVDVEAAYTRARELAVELGDDSHLFPILAALRLLHATRGDWRKAMDHAEHCLALANQSGDPKQLMHAHQAIGITAVHTGELTLASKHLADCIDLYDAAERQTLPGLQDPKVDSLSFGAWVLWLKGRPDQAAERDRAAVTLAKGLEHPFSLAFSLTLSSALHNFNRDMEQQQQQADAARSICSDHGFKWLSACASILYHAAKAHLHSDSKALDDINQSLEMYRDTGARGQLPYLLWLLADASRIYDRPKTAASILDEARQLAEQNAESWWLSEIYRLYAAVEFDQNGATQAATKWCKRGLKVSRDQGARSLQLRAAICQARILRRQRKSAHARRLLLPIYRSFDEGIETPDIQEARQLLRRDLEK